MCCLESTSPAFPQSWNFCWKYSAPSQKIPCRIITAFSVFLKASHVYRIWRDGHTSSCDSPQSSEGTGEVWSWLEDGWRYRVTLQLRTVEDELLMHILARTQHMKSICFQVSFFEEAGSSCHRRYGQEACLSRNLGKCFLSTEYPFLALN